MDDSVYFTWDVLQKTNHLIKTCNQKGDVFESICVLNPFIANHEMIRICLLMKYNVEISSLKEASFYCILSRDPELDYQLLFISFVANQNQSILSDMIKSFKNMLKQISLVNIEYFFIEDIIFDEIIAKEFPQSNIIYTRNLIQNQLCLYNSKVSNIIKDYLYGFSNIDILVEHFTKSVLSNEKYALDFTFTLSHFYAFQTLEFDIITNGYEKIFGSTKSPKSVDVLMYQLLKRMIMGVNNLVAKTRNMINTTQRKILVKKFIIPNILAESLGNAILQNLYFQYLFRNHKSVSQYWPLPNLQSVLQHSPYLANGRTAFQEGDIYPACFRYNGKFIKLSDINFLFDDKKKFISQCIFGIINQLDSNNRKLMKEIEDRIKKIPNF